jgi:hypothetical protein
MSALNPNNEAGLLIDEFIKYAQNHLKTVGGSILTLSSYPAALGTPQPGIINWTGFFVEGAKQSSQDSTPTATIDDSTNQPEGRPEGSPIDVASQDDEFEDVIFGDETIDAGPPAKFNKGANWTPLTRGGSGSGGGLDYSGYTGVSLSASDTIQKIYMPALNKVHPDKSKGIRMLMAAQTQLEGFYPANANRAASLSFRTNNPGNVGTDGIKIGKFTTLEDGIAAQWKQVLGPIYSGKSKYYKTTYSLFEYLSTYAPVMAKDKNGNSYKTTNNPTNYTNFIINYFKGQGVTITAQTTLAELNNIT